MRDPRALISTSALAAQLGDPSLRIYDCTTRPCRRRRAATSRISPCPGWQNSRLPTFPAADFLDMQGEFSDQSTRLRFMMPPIPQLEAAFGRHGLGAGTRVVLYSSGTMM